MKHRYGCSNNIHFLPLRYSILLWSIRNCQLSPDTLLSAISIKLLGGILTPVIRSENLDLPPCLVLHKSFELLEPLQGFLRLLALQKVDLGLHGMVINECHIILVSSQGNKRHRSAQIWMHQVKDPCWLSITARKSSLGVLSQSTPPAHITLPCAELR